MPVLNELSDMFGFIDILIMISVILLFPVGLMVTVSQDWGPTHMLFLSLTYIGIAPCSVH